MNRVLRRVFGPKRDEVTGEWRKLHNEGSVLLTHYCAGGKIEKNETGAGNVARKGEGRGVHRVLVGKPEGKRPLGDPDVDGRIILRWIFRKWEGLWGLDGVGSG